MTTAEELPVQTGLDAMTLANAIFGSGVTLVSASYEGDPLSAGIYSDALTVVPGVAPSDSGVILSTGFVGSFTNDSGATNLSSGTSGNTAGVDGDAAIGQIAGGATFDGAFLSADFVPSGSVLTMQITFSSEEYMEYVGSGFNDAVGIWVNGVKAQLTVGDGDISIDNINAWSNTSLYVDNADGAYNTEMDGFTVTLTLKANVTPGEVNTLRIGIADAGDSAYDSNLMIAAESVQTVVVAGDDTFTMGYGTSRVLDLTANDTNLSGGALVITKINGIPVTAGSTVLLPDGIEVQVNADGTITVVAHGEESRGPHSFTYEVSNADGLTDVGFVNGQIACFVAGARIATLHGMVAVEALRKGDMVMTLDHGPQPLRWIGRRTVASVGAHAAVSIPADAMGRHRGLRVSPQHRILVRGWQAELYFGEEEVLVKAAHLVRAGLLKQDQSGCPVTYYHLLFDRHEIINADGLWSESYLPGPLTMQAHDAETQAEICALFPELALDPESYGPSARPEADARLALLMAAN